MKYRKIDSPEILTLDDSLIIEGDALQALRLLPEQSIQCVVTSPPYWGLRDYGIGGQIGGAFPKSRNVFFLTADLFLHDIWSNSWN